MWTGLTSPSRPWFKITSTIPGVQIDGDAKAWMEDTEKRVYAVLAKSNFYSEMAQGFQDVSCFGTAPLVIYEHPEDTIRCYLPCAGEYYLRAGDDLKIDSLYREYTYTVKQIVGKFGVDNCPVEVREHWQRGGASLDREYVVAHAIEPNIKISRRTIGAAPVVVVPSSFPYREVNWLKGIKSTGPLSKKGFMSPPFMVARWSKAGNDAYGRSPCMDALGDQRQVQIETRRKGEFIDKLVRPPMLADPALKNQPTSIVPGMVTYVDTAGGKGGFKPIFEMNATALAPMIQDIEKVSKRIERALFVDVFMAITQMEGVQPRNELELSKRDLERLQVLGPFVELFETEFAGPAILRVIDIMERRRMLAPMPKSLHGIPLKLDYVSIMKVAQRSAESVAMKDVLQTAGIMSSAAKAAGVPDPLRRINLDKAIQKYADLNNFPSDCLFSDVEVQQHDQARQQAKQAAATPQLAMAGVQAAKTLSETQVPGGSALGAIMGGGGGGAPAPA